MNNIPFRDSETEEGIFGCKLTPKSVEKKGGGGEKMTIKPIKNKWQNSRLVVHLF